MSKGKNLRVLVTVHFGFLILTRKPQSGGLTPKEEYKENEDQIEQSIKKINKQNRSGQKAIHGNKTS